MINNIKNSSESLIVEEELNNFFYNDELDLIIYKSWKTS